MKKIIAVLLSMTLALGCASGVAETTKHERIYVVADADGSVESTTVSIRLENADGLEELRDRTLLTDIISIGGDETFTEDGEDLIWKAGGADIAYQGKTEREPAAVPVVRLTLDGKEITAEELKEKSGEVTLEVSYRLNGEVPVLAVSVLPLPEKGISELRTENATLITEAGQKLLTGWAVAGMDEKLKLPDSFRAVFQADHADLGWMMTVLSTEPIRMICEKAEEYADTDLHAGLDEIVSLLTAMKNGEELPETDGRTKEIVSEINGMNTGLTDLDTAAKTLAEGAAQLSQGTDEALKGTAALDTGLATLAENSSMLNTGAAALFSAVLQTANSQLAGAGLDALGIEFPELTADNYGAVLEALIAQTDGETVKAAVRAKVEEAVRAQVGAREEEIRSAVTEAVRAQVLEAVLKKAGTPLSAEQYQAAVSAGKVDADQQKQVEAFVEMQMSTDEVKAGLEEAVREQTEKLVAENTESYLANDETVAEQLAAVQAGHDALGGLKDQLDQVHAFAAGLESYTSGVDQAAAGATELRKGMKQLREGAAALKDGAEALQTGGTSVLKQSVLDAERKAAEKLLPYAEENFSEALKIYEETRDRVKDCAFDPTAEGTESMTVTIIRTQLDRS